MSKSILSPEPWKIETVMGELLISSDDNQYIASLFDDNLDEMVANARAIKEVPNMISLLREFISPVSDRRNLVLGTHKLLARIEGQNE